MTHHDIAGAVSSLVWAEGKVWIRGGNDKAGNPGRGQFVEHLEYTLRRRQIVFLIVLIYNPAKLLHFCISSPVACNSKQHPSRKFSRPGAGLVPGSFVGFWVARGASLSEVSHLLATLGGASLIFHSMIKRSINTITRKLFLYNQKCLWYSRPRSCM